MVAMQLLFNYLRHMEHLFAVRMVVVYRSSLDVKMTSTYVLSP